MRLLVLRKTLATFAVMFGLAGGVLVAPPAAAQEEQQDVYLDLSFAFLEGFDREAELNVFLKAVRSSYIEDPQIASLEERSSGFLDDLISEFRPIFALDQARQLAETRIAVIPLFRNELTQQEAMELIEIFRSPAVRRVRATFSSTYKPDSTLPRVKSDKAIKAEEIYKDIVDISEEAIERVSKEDRIDADNMIANSSAMKKWQALGPDIMSIRAKIANSFGGPEQSALFASAYARILAKHFPKNVVEKPIAIP